MVKKLLALVSVIAVGCSVIADTALFTLTWDANTEADLAGYNIFIWSGQDTTLCPFVDGEYRFITDALFDKTVGPEAVNTSFLAPADGATYTAVAMSAFDNAGNNSQISLATVAGTNSNFLKPADSQAPNKPQNVEIQ